MKSRNILTSALTAVALSLASPAFASAGEGLAHPAMPTALADAPFALIENAGQWDTPALLIGRMAGGLVRLAPGALELQLKGADGAGLLVRLVFEGAGEDCLPAGEGQLAVTRNYFVGQRETWRSSVASFSSALYHEVAPGIDLRVREQAGHLEYDLLLAPGARASDFVMRCEGVHDLSIDADGALLLATELGPIRMGAPTSWLVSLEGEQHGIASGFRRIDSERFGFVLPDRDAELPAVIDPGVTWATYLGGDDDEVIFDLAFAPDGNIVVAGHTYSDDFPTGAGAYTMSDPELAGLDGFISVLDPTGSTLISSTYLGGGGDDGITGMAVHAGGAVTVVGFTKSTDLPTTASALQSGKGAGWDGFVITLDKTLGTVLYGTYLGDAGGLGSRDWATAAVVDGAGILTVCGLTESNGFHNTSGAFQGTRAGLKDTFVTRLDPSQIGPAQLVWSTFLGGSSQEGFGALTPPFPDAIATQALALDSSGVVTLAGLTHSPDFPTVAAYQPTFGGTRDTFVARLDPSLTGSSQLVWSTFLGGSGLERTADLALDSSGGVTVVGSSPVGFPTTLGAFQSVHAGAFDGFISHLDPSEVGAAQLVWSTLIGGSTAGGAPGGDSALSLVFDANGDAVVCGWTDSFDFPTTGNAQYPSYLGGARDGWIVRLDACRTGVAQLRYSTHLGGTEEDLLTSIQLDSSGDVIVAGFTESPGVATPGAYGTSFNGGNVDGYVARFEFPPDLAASYCTAGISASGCQASITAAGTPSATASSGFDLIVSSVEGNKDGLFFFGTNGRQANPWGTGTSFQCVVPPVKRGGLLVGVGTQGACDGSFTQDLNARWTARPSQNPGAGAVVQAQLWYRDPFGMSNQTTSLSDAIEFCVEP